MTLSTDLTGDLPAMLDTDEFAVAATIGAGTVDGIFDNAFVSVEGIEGTHPIFLCEASEVSSVVHDNTVVIGAVTYKVKGIEPDGTGMTMLILEKQ